MGSSRIDFRTHYHNVKNNKTLPPIPAICVIPRFSKKNHSFLRIVLHVLSTKKDSSHL